MRFEFPNSFSLEQLLRAADDFNFIVDVRGPYPTMISKSNPFKAAQCTCRRDMLHFISK